MPAARCGKMKYVESILPSGKKWKLVWNDEFDGDSLDSSKWDIRTHMMGVRHPGLCGAEGLEFRDSCICFKRVREGDLVKSTQIQTGSNFLDAPAENFHADKKGESPFRWPLGPIKKPHFMHSFGYYEARCKLQKHPHWWSAFWLQSPVIGSSLDPETAGVEVDIMEAFQVDGTFECNNHWNGYGPDHAHAGFTGNLPPSEDGFHLFGVEWAEDGYTFYVDGKEVWRCAEPVSRIKQFILLSTECQGYRRSPGPVPELLDPDLPDDEFVVDFVRVYDRIGD